ncbi:MAG: ABC transporter permease [Anaerolineales bacterium]|nr:ABC transporter permease [Anaerolineales bacterium]MDW8226838.1 ABC transporter permease [Anaerolineales bacterium]
MKTLLKMIWIEMKLFLREPVGAFFTLVFPLMMLFLFGSIYGNKPSPLLGGRGTIDISLPAYTAMIIATTGLMSTPITLAMYREYGILRRLRTTPVHPLVVLGAQVMVLFLMTAVGMCLLVLAGKLVYNVQFEGTVLSLLGGFTLACLSFFGLGFLLASLVPTPRTAQVVGMVLLYPMIFLSGASIPRELLPETIQKIATFLPLTYVVNLLRGLWFGEAWSRHGNDVIVLVVMMVVGVLISAKIFRWE